VHKTTTKYAKEWASEQVLLFYERYTRATDLLAKIASIPTSQLLEGMTWSLASENQVNWIAYKRLIKGLRGDNWDNYKHLPVKMRRAYLTIVRSNAQDEAIVLLDGAKVLDLQFDLSFL